MGVKMRFYENIMKKLKIEVSETPKFRG